MSQKIWINCARYDAAKALQIEQLGFAVHYENCEQCRRKVMLSPATRQMLDARPNARPVCDLCSADLLKQQQSPVIEMSREQVEEFVRLTIKAAAKNN